MDTIKIILVGNSGVGKTSLLSCYLGNKLEVAPTIGMETNTIIIDDVNPNVELQIFDTAGQEKYQGLMPIYFRNAQVAIIVFDLTNKQSFDDVEKWDQLVKMYAADDVMTIMVANKSDLTPLIQKDQIEDMRLQHLCAASYETSAVTGAGIQELFYYIGHEPSIPRTHSNFVVEQKPDQKECC